MDIELTEKQRMIKNMVYELAEKEVKPKAAERDITGEFPADIFQKLAKLNLLGICVPEEYGGAGLDTMSSVIIIEEISRACASTGVIIAIHNSLAIGSLLLYGTNEQKKKYLPPLAKGEMIGCYALTEAQAGSDASNLHTTAELKGDHYILNGTKLFITNGVMANVAIVFATIDKNMGHKGVSCFLVEDKFPGFNRGKVQAKMGINAAGNCELIFDNCQVPKENLLGEEGMGFNIALKTLDGGRIGIAAQAVGIARACLEEALSYSKERIQFSRPIARFQAIQWMLSDMATEIDAARLLTYKAAYCKDKGVKYTKEAAMAKLFASECAMKAATKGVQIFGGYGYMKEYPIERFFRDAKITEIYEGTNEIQRLVIASNLLK